MTVNPNTSVPTGGTVRVIAGIVNNNVNARNDAQVSFYLSSDSTISSSDTLIGAATTVTAANLTNNARLNIEVNFLAPSAGSYFIGACITAHANDGGATRCSSGSSLTTRGDAIGSFTIANEYIDFHSWYGEITWSGATPLDPALIVVSTNARPKTWNGTATVDAYGNLTAAGITGVSVAAIYSRKFDITTPTLETRRVHVAVNDSYTNNAQRSVSSLYEVTDPFHPNIAWTLQTNNSYSLIIYYEEGGSQKSFVHSFSTPAYPINAEQAKLFGGDVAVSSFFNNGLATSQAGAIEIKTNEQLVTSFSVIANHNSKSDLRIKAGNTFYACSAPLPNSVCTVVVGNVFRFLNRQDVDPGPATFIIFDSVAYPTASDFVALGGNIGDTLRYTHGLQTVDRYFRIITE